MKIGLDIDDTLTNTKEAFAKSIKKYCHKHKWKQYNEQKKLTEEEFKIFLMEYGKKTYETMKPKKEAIKIINSWNEMGHEIYFITARCEEDLKGIETITIEYLKKYNINYQSIFFHSKNKGEDSKNLNLDVFVDDRESVLDTLKMDIYKIRMLDNIQNYSKYKKVTSWKEIDSIIKTL